MRPFMPEFLSLTASLSPELQAVTSRANLEVGRFDGSLLGLVNPAVLLSPLTTQEAVLSSRIEGTISTLQEVLLVQASDDVDLAPERRNSAIEVVNYRKALGLAIEALGTRPFTFGLVKDLHKALMDSVRGQDKSRGQIRNGLAFIGPRGATSLSQARYVAPEPLHLPSLLDNLEGYIATCTDDPVIATAIVHAQFEMIHPFEDGNGRIGRMLIPLYLYHCKALHSPVFYLSEYLDKHWETYFAALQGISKRDDWDGWLWFFVKAVEEQAQKNTKKARAIIDLYEITKHNLYDIAKTRFSFPLLDSLFDLVIFKSHGFINYTGIPERTAMRLLHDLRKAGILKILRPKSGNQAAIMAFAELLNLVEGRKVI